ncbi:hypothetical protein JZ751_003186 [Albula glossodonta]|uniref:Kinesin-like protein n=1 Tax=Albula glossodonta TaxID=121402 RepID=A0A8T2NGQ9_9TELE|nr:hypothetical protein JZ751_003186 [Albula glossodonta]
MEDEDQNIHLKNLSIQQSANEEEALNLLFLGDTNRMIAETPMNQASTRSHCIFTVHVCSREPGSSMLRRSKLHLVDLAGSERVGKTGVGGQLLTEAKYINLSLHYLEQVIIALSEKNRTHIPYRNSMMTSVLRDSLGGNCMTTMIATVSVDKRNVDESISTCRFAQRVALIKNEALLNEELDPSLNRGYSFRQDASEARHVSPGTISRSFYQNAAGNAAMDFFPCTSWYPFVGSAQSPSKPLSEVSCPRTLRNVPALTRRLISAYLRLKQSPVTDRQGKCFGTGC